MKNVILKKENGKVIEIEPTKELLEELKSKEIIHKCGENCKNAYTSKCEKIADYIKRNIAEYDFIQSGMQVIDNEGDVEKFLVHECNNYEEILNKKHTAEELKRFRRAREAIRLAYFDAATVEEAYIIQDDLIKRGQLFHAQGKRPTESQIINMKNKEKAKRRNR